MALWKSSVFRQEWKLTIIQNVQSAIVNIWQHLYHVSGFESFSTAPFLCAFYFTASSISLLQDKYVDVSTNLHFIDINI
jgi:hypothetical protein